MNLRISDLRCKIWAGRRSISIPTCRLRIFVSWLIILSGSDIVHLDSRVGSSVARIESSLLGVRYGVPLMPITVNDVIKDGVVKQFL